MILKEEMKARSGCHDNDQWGSRRSSRYSSKEALNNPGFNSLNGCKSEVVSVFDTGGFCGFTPVTSCFMHCVWQCLGLFMSVLCCHYLPVNGSYQKKICILFWDD